MKPRQTPLSTTVRIGIVVMGLTLVHLLNGGSTHAQQREPSSYQEAYLEFEYASGLVSDVVTAQYDGSRFYISVTEVFNLLRIDYTFDREAAVVSGFYLTEDRTYTIDLQRQQVEIGDQEYSISSSDYVLTELDLFLSPGTFSQIFGLNFTPSMRNLNLTLQTSQTMPIVEQAMRHQERTRSAGWEGLRRPDAPLLPTDGFNWFDAGVFDYSLGMNIAGSTADGRFSLQYGGLLLGGDMTGSFRGSFGARGLTTYPSSGEWRLAVDRPYLSQIRVGQLTATGLRQSRYTGVRVTNDPVRIRQTYGSYQVEGTTEPEWEVELYVNGQLIEYTTADTQGRYTFQVPLSYGSTQITIRKYGPTGQMEEENRRMQVPFTFVPKGQVYYSLEAGQSRSPDVRTAQTHASVGLTSWLTSQTGVDFVLNHPESGAPEARYYNKLSARFGGHYILSLHAAPDVRYRASLNANFASRASFTLSYGYNYRDEVFNRFTQQEEIRARATLPLELPYVPILFRLDGTRHKLGETRYSYRLNPSATVRLPGSSRLSFTYRSQIDQSESQWTARGGRLQSDLSYVVPQADGVLGPFSRLRLSTRAEYDIEQRWLNTVSLDVSRQLFRLGQVRLSVERNVRTGITSSNFRLTFNLPYFRTSSSARYTTSGMRFSQDVNGALAFDSRYARVKFDRRGWTGRGGAAIRLFVDGNGNDSYDDGEEIIEEAQVRFRRAQRTSQSDNGIIRATNLQPYDRYNVSVDQSTIPNPLWIPKGEEFSFVAQPNKYSPVDIPFYVAGVVEGSVQRMVDSTLRPVPGLDVIVAGRNNDYRKKIDVFNEGDFYDYTIPPGEYTIYVDSTQRRALKVRSEPVSREFTVEHTEEGDYVSGLTFTLHPLEPSPDEEPQPGLDEETESAREVQFAVQVGAFFNEENAEYRAGRVRQRLEDDLDVTVYHDTEQNLYKALVNPTLNREAVQELRARLAQMDGLGKVFVTTFSTDPAFEEEN